MVKEFICDDLLYLAMEFMLWQQFSKWQLHTWLHFGFERSKEKRESKNLHANLFIAIVVVVFV